jgi:hypothetical protein
MPYISGDRRALYDERIAAISHQINAATPAGDLTYIITRLLVDWTEKRSLSYASLAEAVAVLETAKLEFYRRVGGPYEDQKISDNGDAYGGLVP